LISVAKPLIGKEERKAVDRVLRSGGLAQGAEVASFEEEFSTHISGRSCIAVNSGTSALHLAFIAGGLLPGDEVIVPSFSFAATANSVILAGGKPIFVDVEEHHFNLNPELIEAAITPRTRAIMPVHLYGHPADMVAISDIAAKHELLVFEDAAQAHLASIDGIPVGAWGTAASFSFYPTKNMTSGEGGIVTTSSLEIARLVRLLRNQGMETRYLNEVVGFNSRMTDIHAAIGREQLKKLPKWTSQRKQNAAFLSDHLEGVVTPKIASGMEHVFHQYTIKIVDVDRESFSRELTKRGVGNGVYYPTPIHQLPSFNLKLDLPTTSLLSKQVLSLPIHPSLSKKDLEKIVSTVNAVAKAGS
jgi:perosamine synthetase